MKITAFDSLKERKSFILAHLSRMIAQLSPIVIGLRRASAGHASGPPAMRPPVMRPSIVRINFFLKRHCILSHSSKFKIIPHKCYP